MEQATAIYSSRIIKASALIADTKLLLHAWNLEQPVEENLARLKQENIFGKASRSRVSDILTIFRQRYFTDLDVGQALVTLANAPVAGSWLDPLLYFFTAQNDRTLHDIVTDVLLPRSHAGFTDVPASQIEQVLKTWSAEGKTTSEWGEATILRVVRNILATLRDFGILQGKLHKQITPVFLPTPVFALIGLWLQQQERSGDRVLHSDEWKLFFLPVAGVERFFIEAHQEHLLNYQAAGSIVRIDFPATSLTDYAHVLVERAR